MCKIVIIICALFILTYPALAQNEIDHINTFWASGYGKLALDGDTLYVNILNGHGVERYDLSNLANPVFIDREEVSGFDQIDFNRRLMAKINSTQVRLIDFSNFDSTSALSSFPLILPGMINAIWKLDGNYMMAASADDSLRTFNISDPSNAFISFSIGLIRQPSPYFLSYFSAFGSTVFLILNDCEYQQCLDIYDISQPENLRFDTTYTYFRPSIGGNDFAAAKGDTIAHGYDSFMGIQWYIQMESFAPNDTSRLPSWGGYGEGDWPPAGFSSGFNGFLISHPNFGIYAYSYTNFTRLGKLRSIASNNFGCTSNNYFILSEPSQCQAFQPTYSDSIIMPQIAEFGSTHFGILSSASYGNYILSGAESNGGELLIHQLNHAGQLNLISSLDSVGAKNIIIAGSFAICLLPNKIVQVHLLNLWSPHIEHEIAGFNGALVDFVKQDSLLYLISTNNFYLLAYDSLSGFTQISSLSIPGSPLTSICQYLTGSFILKGAIGTVTKVETANPGSPVITGERRLPQAQYQNIEQFHNTLWASGASGTDVINTYGSMDSVAFFGPEYFSDVHQMFISHDTLYIADGVNGIKVFTFGSHPYYGLTFKGGYSNGNVVNQVATIGNNFFASDYYSLQHLRWGAPTGIEIHDTPSQPEQFALSQNYPNPFNAQTTIRYNLPPGDKSALAIFDITGRQIRHLDISSDKHEIIWDGANQSGDPVSSGIYFYTIEGQKQSARKMILLR